LSAAFCTANKLNMNGNKKDVDCRDGLGKMSDARPSHFDLAGHDRFYHLTVLHELRPWDGNLERALGVSLDALLKELQIVVLHASGWRLHRYPQLPRPRGTIREPGRLGRQDRSREQ
jgi:hypothetical protein